jgi:hypothetical protein
MTDNSIPLGRVLRSSTPAFTVGCQPLSLERQRFMPRFGTLVRASVGERETIYGLIYNVTIEDDAFVRQLVAAGVESAEIIEDQRQKRQVPVVVDVLVVGYGRGEAIFHRLPAQPPPTLAPIYACNPAELIRFTAEHVWLRMVLDARDVPADQLVVAAVEAAAQARPPEHQKPYLVEVGRELARMLSQDLVRLESILKQLKPRAMERLHGSQTE